MIGHDTLHMSRPKVGQSWAMLCSDMSGNDLVYIFKERPPFLTAVQKQVEQFPKVNLSCFGSESCV